MDEKIKTWPLRFPAKENPNMEMALFDWPIVLQFAVKAKVSIDFARLYPFDKPIKSLYFRSFVSVLFARFHFKVIRGWLFAISGAGTARSTDSITVILSLVFLKNFFLPFSLPSPCKRRFRAPKSQILKTLDWRFVWTNENRGFRDTMMSYIHTTLAL